MTKSSPFNHVSFKHIFGAATVAIGLALGAGLIAPALAVGTSDGGSGPSLASAQIQIDGHHYDKAITILRQILAAKPSYADALNLMGYSLRKSGQMDRALQFYVKALKANPNHLGAHEYLGELYVETGKGAKAAEQLAILKGLCGINCEEYKDLKAKIGG